MSAYDLYDLFAPICVAVLALGVALWWTRKQ